MVTHAVTLMNVMSHHALQKHNVQILKAVFSVHVPKVLLVTVSPAATSMNVTEIVLIGIFSLTTLVAPEVILTYALEAHVTVKLNAPTT